LIVASEVVTIGAGLVEVVADDAASGLLKRDFVVADESGESPFEVIRRHVDGLGELVVDLFGVLA
jgi:hypothetical protein